MKKILLLCLLVFPLGALAEKAYFQQEVNYSITVKLDDVKHELTGDETVEYINNSPDELSFIYFHLWPNAYKNDGTALAKQILEGGSKKFYYASPDEKGFIDGLHFRVDGQEVEWKYDSVHSDICRINLNRALKSGERITITTPFHVKIPKGIFSRLGHLGQSYQITQWYPKPAVYDKYGWHQMPYLNQGEFYSEFGSFDVSITLPKNYVVGATGDLVDGNAESEWLNQIVKKTEAISTFPADDIFPPSSEEMKTLRFRQNKVHDFAWFADKRYHVLKGEVELPHSKRKVTTWAMFTNNEAHLWKKSIEYLNDAIYYYSLWNGDYPYNHATAVDGALSAGGGMEYPNITVIGESRIPFMLEMVIMHEVGHNWFYGILGSNERLHPWMDEGLNSFNESRYIRTKYPGSLVFGIPSDKKLVETFDLRHCKSKCQYYFGYLFSARRAMDQPIELTAPEFSLINYATIVYYKTAVVFDYLMAYLGEEKMDRIMQTYFETWKFRHPYPDDLRKILEEGSGKDLSWFFDDLINTTKKLDYKIEDFEVKSENSLSVKIKNVGEINGPFSISAWNKDTLVETHWFEGFKGTDTAVAFLFTKPALEFDKLTIDGKLEMPEINQRNNTIRRKGLCKKTEPLRLQFLGSVENPARTQMFYAPAWGWNNYNKNMVGIAVYNNIFPQKKFEYLLSPMYALGNDSYTGIGNVFYNWFPRTGAVQNAKLGINASAFDYMDYSFPSDPGLKFSRKTAKFYKIAPEIKISLRQKDFRSPRQSFFTIRAVKIYTDNTYYYANSGVDFTDYNDYLINDFSYHLAADKALNPWDVTLNLQGGENFLKSSLEVNHRFEYSGAKGGKSFDLRLFAGKFLFNNTGNPLINWRMDGQNGLYDYAFDHIFLGRTESEGLLSQQFNENHGAFKTPGPIGQSNNWLAALNVKAQLPFGLPLGIFFDAGFFPSYAITYNNLGQPTSSERTSKYIYDAGIHAWIARGFCDIYIPLFYSEDIGKSLEAGGIGFSRTIRFTLNIQKLDPAKLTNNIEL